MSSLVAPSRVGVASSSGMDSRVVGNTSCPGTASWVGGAFCLGVSLYWGSLGSNESSMLGRKGGEEDRGLALLYCTK